MAAFQTFCQSRSVNCLLSGFSGTETASSREGCWTQRSECLSDQIHTRGIEVEIMEKKARIVYTDDCSGGWTGARIPSLSLGVSV